jgi:hypothetical protein
VAGADCARAPIVATPIVPGAGCARAAGLGTQPVLYLVFFGPLLTKVAARAVGLAVICLWAASRAFVRENA